MRRRTATFLTLSALGVLLSGVAASTAPVALADPAPSQDRTRDRASGPRTIDPRELDRGPDAAVDHLQDGVIHAADGTTVRVGIPHGRQRIALLGAVGTAWAVATWRRADSSSGPGEATVDLVRPGAAPVRVPRSRMPYYADSYVGFRLSRDGAQLLTTTYDRGGSTTQLRATATGRLGGTSYSGAFFQPFDADAGHVLTWYDNEFGRLRVADWAGDERFTRVATSAVYADLRRDLMFVRTSGRDFGPTPISAPVVPAWSAPFQPLDVSPDGATAIGLRITRSGFTSRAILDVRSMADGSLVDHIAFGPKITEDTWSIINDHEQTARFEDDASYVFQLTTARGAVLVRCPVGGRDCERASDFGSDISVPFERFMW